MSRYYQLFKTQKERNEWENDKKVHDKNFRVCFRCTANQLKKDLPFVNIDGFKYVTVWANE